MADQTTPKDLWSGAFALQGQSIQPAAPPLTAEIVGYDEDSDSYNIVTRGTGGTKECAGRSYINVPKASEDFGDSTVLPNGSIVQIMYHGATPVILKVLPIQTDRKTVEAAEATAPKVAGKESGGVQGKKKVHAYYRRPGSPRLKPGDWARMSPDGAFVSVLRGKVARVYGSEKAQTIYSGLDGLIKTVCDSYQMISQMGLLEIMGESGHANLSFSGGVDQSTEQGGSENKTRFSINIGALGDMIDIVVGEPNGGTLAQFKMSTDGKVTLLGVKGVEIINAGKAPTIEEHGSDKMTKIMGKESKLILGQASKKIEGGRTTQISSSDTRSVGEDEAVSVNRNRAISVGGNYSLTVGGGSAAMAAPTNVAADVKILNGSYIMDIGNSAAGGSPAAMAGFNVIVRSGSVNLGEDVGALGVPSAQCHVNLATRQPGSIALGGTVEPGPMMAVMHTMIYEKFATMMTTLLTMIDTHTHGYLLGTTSPPSAPVSPSVSASMLNAMSQKVLIHS